MFVIAGVSGNTGKVVAETLLAQKQPVRVLVRDAAKGEPWKAKGAEVAVADLGDADALGRAFAGAKGAYVLAPPNMAVADFRAYQRATVDAIVKGVEKARVPHVVLLSSVGAQHASGTGPIAALHDAEKRLAALPGTKLTAIRAAYFMENLAGSLGMLAQGVLSTFFPADLPVPMVATADIGKLAASVLVEGTPQSQVIELGSPVTMNDVAAALGRIVGKPVTVQVGPVEAMVGALTGFGLPQQMAELYQEMTGAIIRGHVTFEGGGHRRVQGTTSVETVLRGLLGK
jgi:uncharacterized protein YbjT (DUF2867 family)